MLPSFASLFAQTVQPSVVFLVSWMPYVVVSFSETFGSGLPLSRLVTTVPALVAKASCVWNPIIYVGMNANFRTGLISLIPMFRSLMPSPAGNSRAGSGVTAAATVRGAASNMHLSVAYTQTEPGVRATGHWTSKVGVGSTEHHLQPEREERRSTQPCVIQAAPSSRGKVTSFKNRVEGEPCEELVASDGKRLPQRQASRDETHVAPRDLHNDNVDVSSHDLSMSHHVFIVQSGHDSSLVNERSPIICAGESSSQQVYTHERELLAIDRSSV